MSANHDFKPADHIDAERSEVSAPCYRADLPRKLTIVRGNDGGYAVIDGVADNSKLLGGFSDGEALIRYLTQTPAAPHGGKKVRKA